ncbi:DEAD/DEAH box helicase [[Mycoplasma] collis]|uniref:hypothetical protein n=1 Tax=[Mycoplasma] collis TaxID=2127 RepID=UPI0006908AD0|nr:hypothetical protein [[Mycoplasma] collis]
MFQLKNEDLKLVYIRDEAHYGGTIKLDSYEKTFENLMLENADFIIKMTATPKGNEKLIKITEQDLQNDNIKLIKNEEVFNKNIKISNKSEIDSFQLLNIACKEFNEVKKQYFLEKELKNIQPAMLIQVSDKTKNNSEEFDENIEKIIKILEQNNLTWAKYFSDQKIDSNSRINLNLEEISKNNSDINAIIFKVGPGVGWNIPRACMLIRLRNVCSETLNIQTLGRIKRNPNPTANYSKNSIGLKYFVYSDNKLDIKDKTIFNLKKELRKEKFFSGEMLIKNKKEKIVINYFKLWEKFEIFLNDNAIEIFQKIKKFFNLYQNSNNDNDNNLNKNLEFNKDKKINQNLNDNNKYLINEYKMIKSENNEFVKYIISKIYNEIDLKLFVIKFLNKHKNIFSSFIVENIKNWFFKQNNEFKNFNLFLYTIFKEYISNFEDIYNAFLKNIENKTELYEIEKTNFLPENYEEVLLKEKTQKVYANDYAYKAMIDAVKTYNKIELSYTSENENIFISELENFPLEKKDFFIWSKNLPHKGLSFEYLLEGKIFNSYPDFIILYKKKHYLYFEVKGKKDINPKKTENILKAYKKYIENYNNNSSKSLLKNESDISLIICKIESKKEKIKVEGASSNPKIDEKLISGNNELYDIFEILNKL